MLPQGWCGMKGYCWDAPKSSAEQRTQLTSGKVQLKVQGLKSISVGTVHETSWARLLLALQARTQQVLERSPLKPVVPTPTKRRRSLLAVTGSVPFPRSPHIRLLPTLLGHDPCLVLERTPAQPPQTPKQPLLIRRWTKRD